MFYHITHKTVVSTTNFNVEEFKQVFLRETPELLYNYQYSGTQALYKLSDIDNDGVTVVGLTVYDKKPYRKTWKEFYDSIKIEGIGNLYTYPKTIVVKTYTDEEKTNAAEARLLLEKAIELLPKQYLKTLSHVISDVTQDVFKCEPYGDKLYDEWKQTQTQTQNQ